MTADSARSASAVSCQEHKEWPARQEEESVEGAGRYAFGTTEEVIASVTGRPHDDPWLNAVCRALGRERVRTTGHDARRWTWTRVQARCST